MLKQCKCKGCYQFLVESSRKLQSKKPTEQILTLVELNGSHQKRLSLR